MRISFFFSVLLIIAAGLKFLVFYELAARDKSLSGQLTFVFVAYLLTAIIHIKVTGYLVHAVWASWLHDRDIKRFKRSGGSENQAVERKIELPMHADYANGIVVRTHSIVTKSNPGGVNQIPFLVCKGLLFDSEIEEFANKIIDAQARSDLVLKAMENQTRML